LKTSFKNIYDTYYHILYDIALQLCPNYTKAENIFLLTFNKISQQLTEWSDKKFSCIDLIKLMIQIAKEELYPGEMQCNFKIKQFENTPILHKILVEQLCLENYCTENSITRSKAIADIREEFLVIRNINPQLALEAGE